MDFILYGNNRIRDFPFRIYGLFSYANKWGVMLIAKRIVYGKEYDAPITRFLTGAIPLLLILFFPLIFLFELTYKK